MLAFKLSGCVVLGKLLSLSVPWFSHLEIGDDNSIYLIWLI